MNLALLTGGPSENSTKCCVQAIWFTEIFTIDRFLVPLFCSMQALPRILKYAQSPITAWIKDSLFYSFINKCFLNQQPVDKNKGWKLLVHLYFLYLKVLRICKARIPISFWDRTWAIQSLSRGHGFGRSKRKTQVDDINRRQANNLKNINIKRI